jgi:murein L,D-transpeptidase YafK
VEWTTRPPRTPLGLSLGAKHLPGGGITGIPDFAKTPAKHDVESMLVRTLLEVRGESPRRCVEADRHVDLAISDVQARARDPGDLLVARARPLSTIGGGAPNAPQRQLSDFRDEARARLIRHLEEMPLDRVPKYLVQFQPEQKNAIVVDTTKSRLYLFENDNGLPRYVADFYISTGKAGAEKNREGDQKTPLGVYFVTSSLPKSQISDFYGAAAYPISYPNEWDRRLGKDGSGIWLHGVPSDTYSRPPRASNGCVVLSNPDIDRIGRFLQVGVTPVIISDNVEWIDPRDLASQRSAMSRQFEDWRADWESVNTDKYLRHYSRDFHAGRQDFGDWAQQKRQVNAQKAWIKVKVSNVSMFAYPGSDNLVVVTFDQDYSSNNLSNRMKKRQYWKLDGRDWKIGLRRRGVIHLRDGGVRLGLTPPMLRPHRSPPAPSRSRPILSGAPAFDISTPSFMNTSVGTA